MRGLPEDEIERPRRSLTEKIARVGVIVMLVGLFVGLFLYGLAECERYYSGYNDVLAETERG